MLSYQGIKENGKLEGNKIPFAKRSSQIQLATKNFAHKRCSKFKLQRYIQK